MGSFLAHRLWFGLAGVVFIGIWGLMALWHDNDLAKNYLPVEGLATAVAQRCVVVESGWFAEPDREIDCRDAEEVRRTVRRARKRWVDARSTVDFEFISPRDHVHYTGKAVIKNALYMVPKAGDRVTVFIHKSKPATFQYGGRWQDAK